jgi:isoleucyl-tRNA synthetase
MAPVLCFTAEEIWQELQALGGAERWGESTVHAEEFPSPARRTADTALLERWERLVKIRDDVNKALERARAAKTIGTSLEARVTLEASETEVEFLRSFGDELRFLFIVAGVEFGSVGPDAHRSEDVEGLAVDIEPATGEKCSRCWNYTDDVGRDADWPEICARCARHVREGLSDSTTE